VQAVRFEGVASDFVSTETRRKTRVARKASAGTLASRPVFRLERHRGLVGGIVGFAAGLLVTVFVGRELGVVGFVVGMVVGTAFGRSRKYGVCSEPGCRGPIAPDDATCGRCHRVVRGIITDERSTSFAGRMGARTGEKLRHARLKVPSRKEDRSASQEDSFRRVGIARGLLNEKSDRFRGAEVPLVRFDNHRASGGKRGSRVTARYGEGKRKVARAKDNHRPKWNEHRSNIRLWERFAVRVCVIDPGSNPPALFNYRREQV